METVEPASDGKKTPSSGESRLAAGLEVMARAVAAFVAVIYATGFLIVAVHHAQYGIAQFDPLKPKIFSTGIVFVLLVAVPAVAAFRTFQIFGFQARGTVFGIACKPGNETAGKIIVGMSFVLAAHGLTLMFTFLFEPFNDLKPWGLSSLLVLGALFIVAGALARKYFNEHSELFVLGNFVLMLLYVVVVYRFYDHHQFALALWFYAVGIGAVVLSKWLQPDKIRQVEWEQRLPLIAGVLLTYSTLIYGHVKPAFGRRAKSRCSLLDI